MGMISMSDTLSATLFGKSRRAVLLLLHTHPDESLYLCQIGRIASAGTGSIQREMKALAED